MAARGSEVRVLAISVEQGADDAVRTFAASKGVSFGLSQRSSYPSTPPSLYPTFRQ